MKPWTNLGRQVLHQSRVLSLGLERIRTGEGAETDWTVVEISDGAAVIPRFDDGDFLLIRQWRPAAGGPVYELPAGRVDPGESPEAAARRELEEEGGFRAEILEPLGMALPLDGICRHRIHYFLGRGLRPVDRRLETFESIETRRCPPRELSRMVRDGEIVCGVLLTGLARLLLRDGEARAFAPEDGR